MTVHFKSETLIVRNRETKRIHRIAKAFSNGHRLAREAVIVVRCAGGCGSTVRVRADKVREGQIFVCNNKETRLMCRASIPRTIGLKVRAEHHQSASHMTGLTWEDKGVASALAGSVVDAIEVVALPILKLLR